MSKLFELQELEQSIWYDNIRRALIDSGELQELIDAGVTGVTSNPSIFEKAIAGSADYDSAIAQLAADLPPEEIYERLALEDIRRVADLLHPVYDATRARDGYVSLEVSPTVAHDTSATIAEARRLFAALGRRNVMIKVPATSAGVPAIEQLIAAGINVNVTLIFALAMYEVVAEAYFRGLERLVESGGDPASVRSVASFFVSRVDSALDDLLASRPGSGLEGTIGIANSEVSYARFRELYAEDRWKALAVAGARPQRLLWASTGTKNPAYPDTLYVDALIGSETVNTVPPATLDFFLDHGTATVTLGQNPKGAQDRLHRLAKHGIDLTEITDRLQVEGVASFVRAFESLMRSVAEKKAALESGVSRITADLGPLEERVAAAVKGLRDHKIMRRIWVHDHTVWRPEPEEISNRLGWLHLPEVMPERLGALGRFVDRVREDGLTHALLLGMGGSSLAPEGFQAMFGGPAGGANRFLELAIIDSTDPDMIRAQGARVGMERTLFIVATKSGGTVETLSGFKHFYNRMLEAVGPGHAGEHFIAITDPGSQLIEIAERHGFRETFVNDPNIGGRYSALSYFGLVPAALVGVDISLLLERAATAACNAASTNCPAEGDNDAGRLGAMLGELAKAGRDKLTITTSPEIASFGDWVEQLIAESTGKDGKGVLPVVGEPLGPHSVYGADRVFVDLRVADDRARDQALDGIAEAGHPVIRLRLRDKYDVGAQFFLWEMATAVAGHLLQIQPFDQPDVEAAKILARDMVSEYARKGELPDSDTTPVTTEALAKFLVQARPSDYVALQAYVHPTGRTTRALHKLRVAIRNRLGVATTSAYGPRFLHSTGQLHKGDGGNGLFIQLTSDAREDLAIPDATRSESSSMSFQVLKLAQALGDAQALRNAGRRVIRFHLGDDVPGGVARLFAGVA